MDLLFHAVPLMELTTLNIPFLIISKCSISKFLFLLIVSCFILSPGKDLIILGIVTFPPFIKFAVIIANSRGVDNKKPCPIPTFKVSPFCHFLLKLFFFHFLLGIILLETPKNSS